MRGSSRGSALVKSDCGRTLAGWPDAVRRREEGSLRLRFFEDYVVFNFHITSFLARYRCNVVNFNPMSH